MDIVLRVEFAQLGAILDYANRIERKVEGMSQLLDDKLSELGLREDEVIALVQTNASTLSALQAAYDALSASQGGDSVQVAEVQALIDKLTPLLSGGSSSSSSSGSSTSSDSSASSDSSTSSDSSVLPVGVVGPLPTFGG